MDADKMDYLLRDSHHTGVDYGRFDLDRVIDTVRAIPGADMLPPKLGISEDGWHAAEALVLARYFMFTQVYFHKTRVAYDVHLKGALQQILPNGTFPKPTDEELVRFMEWDDWRVLGKLAEGFGGEHGERLRKRDHFRRIHKTNEICTEQDLDELERVKNELGDRIMAEETASKSWYKTGNLDIAVFEEGPNGRDRPLSKFSNVIASLKSNNQVQVYVKPEDVAAGRKAIERVKKP